MITFKQYLEESRSAPLYHGTSVKNLLNILDSDFIKASDGDTSLTRNFNFARDWAEDKFRGHAVIQFDQQKLTNNHRVRPYNYWSDQDKMFRNHNIHDKSRKVARGMGDSYRGEYSNEFEEYVKGDIRNLHRMVTVIYVPTTADKEKVEHYMEVAREDEGKEWNARVVVGFSRPVK